MHHLTVYQVDTFTREPLTGNPAGVVLDADGLPDAPMQAGIGGDGVFTFRARQGEAMDRPGVAHVAVDVHAGRPVCVRVGGDGVIAFRGTLRLPVSGSRVDTGRMACADRR